MEENQQFTSYDNCRKNELSIEGDLLSGKINSFKENHKNQLEKHQET
jgi:hypothetical protein